MNRRFVCFCICGLLLGVHAACAEPTNIAEDDASSYGGSWGNEKNSGSGFAPWITVTEGAGQDQHAGFFIADTSNNSDLNGIAKDGKAFGLFANGAGFEQAVAFRGFNKALEVGDSFSFMMETGGFEKKSDKDTAGGGAVGLVLRSGNSSSSPADYNAGAMFEIGHYQGTTNYQIYDGTANSDSGVAFSDSGIIVTVTVTGSDSYDLEIQTAKDKNLTTLPGRKFGSAGSPKSGSIESMAIFNRNGEKNDAYFNGFQISRDSQ
jgi:hypothetical protein